MCVCDFDCQSVVANVDVIANKNIYLRLSMHANAYVVLIVSDCTKVLQLHLPANANVCDNYDNYD